MKALSNPGEITQREVKAKSKSPISALLRFSERGSLQATFLNGSTKEDQEVLEKALDRLIKPSHFGWLKRSF